MKRSVGKLTKKTMTGGFCAEKPNVVGGVWTTSEFLFTFMKFKLLPRGIIVFKGLKIGLSVTKT
ncbi:MAG: hypothetical protein WC046_06535 [Candidatus Bathyarchaeia archaeon]